MATKTKLTDAFVRALLLAKTQQQYPDDVVRGLFLTVGVRTKTFMLLLRTANGRRRVKLGLYPDLSLGKARELARDRLAQNRLTKTEPPRTTFREAFETYQRTHLSQVRPVSRDEQIRIITKHFRRLDKRQLADITSHDIAPLIDCILKPAARRAAFVAASMFLNWCVKRSYLDASPIARLEAPKKSEPRDRVLSSDELVAVWRALPDTDYGRICRLLVLTGQRANQWAAVRGEYISADSVTWPSQSMKGAKPHTIPLTPLSRSFIPRERIGLFFPSEAGTPFCDWHRSKQKLDKESGVTGYVHHDWRRTWATISAEEICTEPHIIESVLAHATGSQIARTYNRAKYQEPMRKALLAFEEGYIFSYRNRRIRMSDGNFSDFIAKDRARLQAEREAIFNQQHELEGKLAAINNEMRAIDAYEAAKSGKALPAVRSASARAPRARSGSKREGILEAIKNAAGGLTRGELLTTLGLKGDKSGEMSVSNALTALTKGNQVRRDGRKYHAAS